MIDFRKKKSTGTLIYYLLWPLVWFYAPLRVRVRVFVVNSSKALVLKNWFGPNVWQLPGGGMKIGETSIETAAREIKEELGIDISDTSIKLISEDVQNVHKFGLMFRYVYAVVHLDKKPKITMSHEITDSKWVNIYDIEAPASIKSTL